MHVIPLLVTVLIAADPNHADRHHADQNQIAQKITLNEPRFDGVEEALHIISKSGTLELAAPRSRATLEIEGYKDGQQLPLVQAVGVESRAAGTYRFTVQIIDMDYLTLGDGKKGHSRLLVKLGVNDEIGSHAMSSPRDVPKDMLDFSKMTSGAPFKPKASTEDRVPLFWMIGNTNDVKSGQTPEEVVRANPHGDLAIVSIRLSK
jgi:hypothetical protein